MKKLIKTVALATAVILSLTCLAACGQNGGGETTTAPPETSTEPETQAPSITVTPGKLIMATNAAFPPYEYYEGKQVVGIDAEIGELIAKKMGLTLEIKDMDFNGILGAIEGGVADVGLAGMTVKEDRLEHVNFSTSYCKGVQVVIVKENGSIKTLDDLKDKKIGVQQSTTGDSYATDDYGEENVTRYDNGAAAVAALQQGIVDAVIIDNEPAKAFVKGNAGLTILETVYADEDYAIAVAKGNTALLGKINEVLAELSADGSLKKIIDKYIHD